MVRARLGGMQCLALTLLLLVLAHLRRVRLFGRPLDVAPLSRPPRPDEGHDAENRGQTRDDGNEDDSPPPRAVLGA